MSLPFDTPLTHDQVASEYGADAVSALDALVSTDGPSDSTREYRTSVSVADGNLVALRYGTSFDGGSPDHYVLEIKG